jgi:hypothetical protein
MKPAYILLGVFVGCAALTAVALSKPIPVATVTNMSMEKTFI